MVISRAFEVLPGWRFRLCWSGPRLEALAPKWIRGASVGTQLPVYPARLKARKPMVYRAPPRTTICAAREPPIANKDFTPFAPGHHTPSPFDATTSSRSAQL